MQFVGTRMSNKCLYIFQTACPIFPVNCVEVQRPDAALQVFQLPVSQLAGLFFFFSMLAFLPIGFSRAKPCKIHVLINLISHVHQPFLCKIWNTSDFQTQFNTPAVYSIFDSNLGLNTARSLRMPDGRIATEHFRGVDMVPLESSFQTCMFCSSSCNKFTPWNPLALWDFVCNRFSHVLTPALFVAEANLTSIFRMTIAGSVESSMLGLMERKMFVTFCHARAQQSCSHF